MKAKVPCRIFVEGIENERNIGFPSISFNPFVAVATEIIVRGPRYLTCVFSSL
jgi:hypothetical protein